MNSFLSFITRPFNDENHILIYVQKGAFVVSYVMRGIDISGVKATKEKARRRAVREPTCAKVHMRVCLFSVMQIVPLMAIR